MSYIGHKIAEKNEPTDEDERKMNNQTIIICPPIKIKISGEWCNRDCRMLDITFPADTGIAEEYTCTLPDTPIKLDLAANRCQFCLDAVSKSKRTAGFDGGINTYIRRLVCENTDRENMISELVEALESVIKKGEFYVPIDEEYKVLERAKEMIK